MVWNKHIGWENCYTYGMEIFGENNDFSKACTITIGIFKSFSVWIPQVSKFFHENDKRMIWNKDVLGGVFLTN